jgi:hypothetical protein
MSVKIGYRLDAIAYLHAVVDAAILTYGLPCSSLVRCCCVAQLAAMQHRRRYAGVLSESSVFGYPPSGYGLSLNTDRKGKYAP